MAKKKGRLELIQMKQAGEKAAWITAYDFPTAQFAEAAGIFERIGDRDRAALSYLQKCRSLVGQPPADWNGVWVVTTK